MSKDLEPMNMGMGKLFFSSQFCVKPKPPPPSTSLAGQTAIVTGSNMGIGLECCNQFLKLQLSHLIMAVRSPDKGEKAAAPLRKAYPKAKIEVWNVDMLSYESIQAFATRCKIELPNLDIAVLNAGLLNPKFETHKTTGHETMFQTNYLSTALLTALLLPILKKKSQPNKPGRLTVVSSSTLYGAKFTNHSTAPLFKSFDNGTGWDMALVGDRYAMTKAMQLVFVSKMAEHVKSSDVILNAVDPGFVIGTGLHRDTGELLKGVIQVVKLATARSLKAGAWTYVDAAVVKGEESHGSMLMDWKVAP
jgi:NAD(P)-dependent dehydrogenase (short-subunit alcohol dehydrogenase family)